MTRTRDARDACMIGARRVRPHARQRVRGRASRDDHESGARGAPLCSENTSSFVSVVHPCLPVYIKRPGKSPAGPTVAVTVPEHFDLWYYRRMVSTSRSSIATLRADMARAAFAASHGILPEDIDAVADAHSLADVDDALDTVFLDHGIIDFDRHFPHEHKADPSSPFPLCTFTAPTGEMCQEPLP